MNPSTSSIPVPTRGSVIKRLQCGSLFLVAGSSKIHGRCGSEYFTTHVRNNREGIRIAQEMLENRWRVKVGIIKQTDAITVPVKIAFEEYMRLRVATRSKATLAVSRYSFRMVFGNDNCDLTTENVMTKIEALLYRDRKSTRLNSSHANISYAV